MEARERESSDGLQSKSDRLQPKSGGIQPSQAERERESMLTMPNRDAGIDAGQK